MVSASWCAENEAGVSHTTTSAAVTPPSPLFVDCGGGSKTESDGDTSRQTRPDLHGILWSVLIDHTKTRDDVIWNLRDSAA